MNIQILPATPEDVVGINTVLYKAWLATYPNAEVGITIDDIEESYKPVFTEESILKRQESMRNIPANQKRIVAKVDGVVVGCSTVIKNEHNTQLKTIYVLPEFQGKGIGKALWVEQQKFCDPEKDIVVEVVTYNTRAIKFYEKLGFVDTGKRFSDERFRMKSGAILPEMEMMIRAIHPEGKTIE